MSIHIHKAQLLQSQPFDTAYFASNMPGAKQGIRESYPGTNWCRFFLYNLLRSLIHRLFLKYATFS